MFAVIPQTYLMAYGIKIHEEIILWWHWTLSMPLMAWNHPSNNFSPSSVPSISTGIHFKRKSVRIAVDFTSFGSRLVDASKRIDDKDDEDDKESSHKQPLFQVMPISKS